MVHLLHQRFQVCHKPFHQKPGLLWHMRWVGVRPLRHSSECQPPVLSVGPPASTVQSRQIPTQAFLLGHCA